VPTISTRRVPQLGSGRLVGHEDRLAPLGATLLVERHVEPAREMEQPTDDEFRHRDRVDAGRRW
jgi:hypothetical protein